MAAPPRGQGGRQVRAELEGVGEAGSRGFGRHSREMEAANARLAAFSRRARVAVSAAAAGVTTALAAMTRATIQVATQTQAFAQVANTAPEAFQRWAGASRTVGVEQEKLADILKDVNDRVGDFLSTGGGFEGAATAATTAAQAAFDRAFEDNPLIASNLGLTEAATGRLSRRNLRPPRHARHRHLAADDGAADRRRYRRAAGHLPGRRRLLRGRPHVLLGLQGRLSGGRSIPCSMNTTIEHMTTSTRSAWGAVLSMALCVAVLIASEFMPVSLLTPVADELGVTGGQAGQAISISGLFAVITSLSIAGLTRTMDRKLVQSSFAALLVVSGLIVTFAPDYTVLMVGRALLGVAIGGLMFDGFGWWSAFALAAVLLLGSSIAAFAARRDWETSK